MVDTTTYRSKPYAHFVWFIFVSLIICDVIFNVPILGAIALFMVSIVSMVEMLRAYKSNKPYPTGLGKMEKQYGRKNTTIFFIFLAIVTLIFSLVKGYRALW